MHRINLLNFLLRNSSVQYCYCVVLALFLRVNRPLLCVRLGRGNKGCAVIRIRSDYRCSKASGPGALLPVVLNDATVVNKVKAANRCFL